MIHPNENYIVAIVRRRLDGACMGSFAEYPSREQQLRTLLRGFRPEHIPAVENVAKTAHIYSWVGYKDQLCKAAGFADENAFYQSQSDK